MRRQKPQDAPYRSQDTAPENTPDAVPLSPILEFLGIGMLLALLLLS